MKPYLISLIGAAIAVALIRMLSPEGEGSSIAKHVKLLTALLLISVLISPVVDLIGGVRAWASGEHSFPWEDRDHSQSNTENLQNALDSASTTYFSDMLTQTVANRFGISPGEVRCAVQWTEAGDALVPERVTVILSGQAIWLDPAQIETFVRELLGCDCVSAIE